MIRVRVTWGLSGIEIKSDAPYSPDVADDLIARAIHLYNNLPDTPDEVTEIEETHG
jgi:hypothetical protein